MLQLPDRLSALMGRIERGEQVTRADLDRVAALQCFDLARLGREALRQACEENERQLLLLRSLTE